MQFLSISENLRLSELADAVGTNNVDSILTCNRLARSANVGKQFQDVCNKCVSDFLTPDEEGNVQTITQQRKISLLDQFTGDSDIFEAAALQNELGWILLSELGTFPQRLQIPAGMTIPDSIAVIGNGVPVSETVYRKTINSLQTAPFEIDPGIFNDYSTIRPAVLSIGSVPSTSFSEFPLPWGKVTLYSSITDTSVDFPVYPEEVSDGVKANYTEMPELLYQYEPWQIYTSSGPRSNTYNFKFHRDMWGGDHTQGGANELVRFCMANCYPKYKGSAVYTSLVTLYINGEDLITGIMTDVSPRWSGPLGHDGWYLVCDLSITITEVSQQPLNFESVRLKPLIG